MSTPSSGQSMRKNAAMQSFEQFRKQAKQKQEREEEQKRAAEIRKAQTEKMNRERLKLEAERKRY